MNNAGKGACIFTALFDALHLPNRNRGNLLQGSIQAMNAIKKEKNHLSELSQESREVIRCWQRPLLRRLKRQSASLSPESQWNMELINFYISYCRTEYQVFFFRQVGEHMFLLKAPKFEETRKLKKPIFIAQTQADGYWVAVNGIDGNYEKMLILAHNMDQCYCVSPTKDTIRHFSDHLFVSRLFAREEDVPYDGYCGYQAVGIEQ